MSLDDMRQGSVRAWVASRRGILAREWSRARASRALMMGAPRLGICMWSFGMWMPLCRVGWLAGERVDGRRYKAKAFLHGFLRLVGKSMGSKSFFAPGIASLPENAGNHRSFLVPRLRSKSVKNVVRHLMPVRDVRRAWRVEPRTVVVRLGARRGG